jgi:hypothetical protein
VIDDFGDFLRELVAAGVGVIALIRALLH